MPAAPPGQTAARSSPLVTTPPAKPAVVVPYDRAWQAEFVTLAQQLRTALGDLATRIDHIGSTSVTGLPAKDVIDVQISVTTLDDLLAVTAALVPLGYVPRPGVSSDHVPPGGTGDRDQWRKAYLNAPPSARATNIHVRVDGHANQRYALLFRDYLRAHPRSAAAYAETKRRLAAQFANDLGTYADVKDPVCDIIMAAAEDWAAAAGWKPGPSDA